MGTNGALLCVSLSLSSFTNFSHSGSLSSSSVTCSCLRSQNSSSPDFPFSCEDLGKWGEMARLYLSGDSQSASCIIMRSDISIHTKLFLSLCAFVLPSEAEYLRPLSLTMRFPHTSFFQSHFYPKHPHNTFFFFFFPSFLSTLEYPVFHLAAQWAV